MKPPCDARRAFTLVELLVVIAIIGILASLLLPSLGQAKLRAQRIQCVSNQRQVGLAFNLFQHDHNGHYPMTVPTQEGGSAESTTSGFNVGGDFYFSFRHFQALSNDLSVTRPLLCPRDITRSPAANFATLQNQNVSYFVGVNASFAVPNSILAGDRNLRPGPYNQPTLLRIDPALPLQWTRGLHQFRGNILFADGHVEELNQKQLTALVNRSRAVPLVFPSVPFILPPPASPQPGSGNNPGYPRPTPSPPPPPPPAAPPGNNPPPAPPPAPGQSAPRPSRVQPAANAEVSGAPPPTNPVVAIPRDQPGPPAAEEVEEAAQESNREPIEKLTVKMPRSRWFLLFLLLLLLFLLECFRRHRKRSNQSPARAAVPKSRFKPGFYQPGDSEQP